MKHPAPKEDLETPDDFIWVCPSYQFSLITVLIPQIPHFWFGVRKWHEYAGTDTAGYYCGAQNKWTGLTIRGSLLGVSGVPGGPMKLYTKPHLRSVFIAFIRLSKGSEFFKNILNYCSRVLEHNLKTTKLFRHVTSSAGLFSCKIINTKLLSFISSTDRTELII